MQIMSTLRLLIFTSSKIAWISVGNNFENRRFELIFVSMYTRIPPLFAETSKRYGFFIPFILNCESGKVSFDLVSAIIRILIALPKNVFN